MGKVDFLGTLLLIRGLEPCPAMLDRVADVMFLSSLAWRGVLYRGVKWLSLAKFGADVLQPQTAQ